MEVATTIDQLWLVLRENPLLVHLILLEALVFIAILLFGLRLRRISQDLARIRSRTRQISDAMDAANPAYAEYRSGLYAVK